MSKISYCSFCCPPNCIKFWRVKAITNEKFPNTFIFLGSYFNYSSILKLWSGGTLLESYLLATTREDLLQLLMVWIGTNCTESTTSWPIYISPHTLAKLSWSWRTKLKLLSTIYMISWLQCSQCCYDNFTIVLH